MELTRFAGLPATARAQVWECLDRLARGGIACRVPQTRLAWTRTRLTGPLLTALPGPDGDAVTTAQLATTLRRQPDTVEAGLAALAACGICHRVPITRAGGPWWRLRPAGPVSVPPMLIPVRVVSLIASRPATLTAALAQAVFDALAGSGALAPAHHDRIYLRAATGHGGALGVTSPTLPRAELFIIATPTHRGDAGPLGQLLDRLPSDTIRGAAGIAAAVESSPTTDQQTTADALSVMLSRYGVHLAARPLIVSSFASADRAAAAWLADVAADLSRAFTPGPVSGRRKRRGRSGASAGAGATRSAKR